MEKSGELFDLFQEVLVDRSFKDHKRLLEILRSTRANLEASIIPHGNQYVLARLQAYGSNLGRFDETTDGLTYHYFIKELLERAEKDPAKVAAEFEQVAAWVFTQDNLLVNLTAKGKDLNKLQKVQNKWLMFFLPVCPTRNNGT